ncbi:hypothetical protein [Methylocystis sp. B8]|uniref:hypothetical protein n=1 Tax=Methylocystis sp. B8 TaxID=544938 RepID=UPI0010FD911A|nr:hypothetical protein [Methylocystis sp. B8]TLG78139.1 hypothetical protein FEV16_06145 [Methylocystis sp. B8]
MLSSATGQFNPRLDDQDTSILEAGFGIGQSNTDQVFGNRLLLDAALLDWLAAVSSVGETHTLVEISNFPEDELKRARDDARTAMGFLIDFYDATSPVFEKKAFGLHQAALHARKSTANTQALFVLVIAALRRYSNSIVDSETIADLGKKASECLKASEQVQKLQQAPEFQSALSARNLRRGFASHDSYWDLLRKIEAAKLGKESV